MNAPDYIGNAISEYIFTKNDLIPGIPDRRDAYDKMAVVMITLNEDEKSSDAFLNLMNTLISEKLSVEEKKKCLENDYGIMVEGELEERVNVMCNYSDMIEEKSIEKGRKQGIESNCKKTVQRMLKYGKYTYEEIADITELSIEEVKKIEAEMTATA